MSSRYSLERNQKLSKSLLWAAQRQYFDQEGVEAWAGAVPFYITSNPFIANAYAEVFIRYVQDLIQKGANPKAPFYVFELGTGSGRFSFLCMKTLFRLQEALGIDANIVYVMTDFTESNLKFWQQHERLKPYVEAGKLDFARYDMDQDSALYLVNRNLTLKPGSLENPLMLVANYIFDTVSHDAFRVSNGTLYESLISLETGSENVRNGMPIKLDGVESHFEHRPILEAYYHQPILDGILHRYAQLLINSTFLFPVGAFKSLDCFRALSQGRMLLISTDKGYHSLFELEGRDDPRPVMHGSFSMSVNFHAIGEYFRALKGDFLFQESRDSIKTCAFVMGDEFEFLPETSLAIQHKILQFGPGDYFSLHRNLRDTRAQDVSMTTLLAQMNLSRWDPYVLSVFSDRIIKELGKSSPAIIRGFVEGAPHLIDNVYKMPGNEDYYFNIAILYHTAEDYAASIPLYEASLKTHGDKFATLYNLGLCYYMTGNRDLALQYLESAQPLDTQNRAQEWIHKIKSNR